MLQICRAFAVENCPSVGMKTVEIVHYNQGKNDLKESLAREL